MKTILALTTILAGSMAFAQSPQDLKSEIKCSVKYTEVATGKKILSQAQVLNKQYDQIEFTQENLNVTVLMQNSKSVGVTIEDLQNKTFSQAIEVPVKKQSGVIATFFDSSMDGRALSVFCNN